MKIQHLFLTLIIVLSSCKTKPKGNLADNRGPNDGKEPHLIVALKDTINVMEYIEMANDLQQIRNGGSTEEIKSKKIVKYNNSNKDTILASIKIKGIIHPPTIGNPPPDAPFERLENYIFYKVNGEWKAEKK